MAAGTASEKILDSSHTCGEVQESQLFKFAVMNFFILEVVGISHASLWTLWNTHWVLPGWKQNLS